MVVHSCRRSQEAHFESTDPLFCDALELVIDGRTIADMLTMDETRVLESGPFRIGFVGEDLVRVDLSANGQTAKFFFSIEHMREMEPEAIRLAYHGPIHLIIARELDHVCVQALTIRPDEMVEASFAYGDWTSFFAVSP